MYLKENPASKIYMYISLVRVTYATLHEKCVFVNLAAYPGKNLKIQYIVYVSYWLTSVF